jgi:hypothetical protein
VDDAGARIGDGQHVARPLRVDLVHAAQGGAAEGHHRGSVQDHLAAGQRLADQRRVAHVAEEALQGRVLEQRVGRLGPEGQHTHAGAQAAELPHQVPAEKAAAAGHAHAPTAPERGRGRGAAGAGHVRGRRRHAWAS